MPLTLSALIPPVRLHMEVVEWSTRLARKREFQVRCLLAPLSMMYILR